MHIEGTDSILTYFACIRAETYRRSRALHARDFSCVGHCNSPIASYSSMCYTFIDIRILYSVCVMKGRIPWPHKGPSSDVSASSRTERMRTARLACSTSRSASSLWRSDCRNLNIGLICLVLGAMRTRSADSGGKLSKLLRLIQLTDGRDYARTTYSRVWHQMMRRVSASTMLDLSQIPSTQFRIPTSGGLSRRHFRSTPLGLPSRIMDVISHSAHSRLLGYWNVPRLRRLDDERKRRLVYILLRQPSTRDHNRGRRRGRCQEAEPEDWRGKVDESSRLSVDNRVVHLEHSALR